MMLSRLSALDSASLQAPSRLNQVQMLSRDNPGGPARERNTDHMAYGEFGRLRCSFRRTRGRDTVAVHDAGNDDRELDTIKIHVRLIGRLENGKGWC